MALVFAQLLRRVDYDWQTDCWNWKRYRTEDGYGRLCWNAKLRLAHRLSLHLYGKLSKRRFDNPNVVVMHTCDNPACINPEHLRAGTQLENIADRCRKGRTARHLNRRDATGKFRKTTVAFATNQKETTMSLMPLDFSGEVTPLQPGTYTARIVAAEARTSAAGNPYINWQLETFGSPEVNGRRVFHTTPTTGGWVSKLAELHKAATGEDIDKKAKSYDPEMLIGKEITATLANRSYTSTSGEAKTSLEIKAVAPAKH